MTVRTILLALVLALLAPMANTARAADDHSVNRLTMRILAINRGQVHAQEQRK
jgi:hypothetical protein